MTRRKKRTLRDWRESLGLTLDEVASHCEYSISAISQVERGLPLGNIAARHKAVRQALLWIAKSRRSKARRKRYLEREQRQIANAWERLDESKGDLVEALRNRAWRLLDDGKPEEADAIGFALPGDVYQEMLDEYFGPDWDDA